MEVLKFITLFFLLLVTGVFWGNWASFSRSYHEFSLEELVHIAKVIIRNLAVPMRFIALCCIGSMLVYLWFYPQKDTLDFYLIVLALALILCSIGITVAIEVPINNQIITWTPATAPANWQAIRNRWQFYNGIRVITALASFAFFSGTVII